MSFEEFFSDSGMESLFIKKKKKSSGLLTCSVTKLHALVQDLQIVTLFLAEPKVKYVTELLLG